MHRALFAQARGSGEVECRLCPHFCRLRPGQTGACQVRHNRDGELVSSAYGRPVLLAVEPIEKKYLYHALPGTATLSLGTAGCNLSCRYCINWRVSQEVGPAAEEVSPAEVVARARAAGVRWVVFTYTEPTIFFEYAEDIARLARAAGLAVGAKTNGFITPDAFERMASWLDAVNIDLKGWPGPVHTRLIGGAADHALDSARLAARLGLWVELTTLVVPGQNDTEAELDRLAQFIAEEIGRDTPWHLLRFYPHHQMRDIPPTSLEVMQRAVACGRRAELRYLYSREVEGGELRHTRCAGCGAVLVRRDEPTAPVVHLRGGACPRCERPLPGFGLTAPS